jgi:transketolase
MLNQKIGQLDVELAPTRNGFGEGLIQLGRDNPNVVALSADLAESTRVLDFAKEFPNRFIQCGVAEQNMMGVAAGLALYGKIPFLASYATFSPGRSWDQFRVSVCYSQANVKVIGGHAGLSVGPDGATHQALEDIAMTRVLPGLTVVVPCDALEARKATMAIGTIYVPVYLRLTREKTPIITTEDTPFELGKANILKEGSDIALIGVGPVLYNGLLAALELEKQGISVMVINSHTVKPLDDKTILEAAKKCKAVVTLEEHQITGGLGGAVCELLSAQLPTPVIRVGIKDHFGESGEPNQLIEKYGLGVNGIIEACQKAKRLK